MKLRTKEKVLKVLKDAMPVMNFMSMPWGESFLDHRDINRLLSYLTIDEAADTFGDALNVRGWHDTRPWDIKFVAEDIKSSLRFAFEKALDRRGISASLMHSVMRMWMWIIQDEDLTEGDPFYNDYGLAYLYRIRDKYFPKMKP